MKVFLKEYCRDVIIRIYGIDGDEHTREFFEKYLTSVDGVYETTEAERAEYRTKGVFTITKAEYFNFLAQQIGNIQQGIDEVADELMRGKTISDYTFNGVNYVI